VRVKIAANLLNACGESRNDLQQRSAKRPRLRERGVEAFDDLLKGPHIVRSRRQHAGLCRIHQGLPVGGPAAVHSCNSWGKVTACPID
jgi:hypothetical protein